MFQLTQQANKQIIIPKDAFVGASDS
jgi:hypothetical protein